MSSTTERPSDGGQILVLFAGSLLVIFLVAALAFDVGMTLLERRDQQNAADAAALAGARYVQGSAAFNGSCAAAGGHAAVVAACEIALANDFNDAASDENVFVRIPPTSGPFRTRPGYVQVQINASRPSIFAGVIGIGNWAVGANAVAANQPGVSYSFGMMALSEDACKAIHISGSGTVNSASSVQSNSTGALCGGSPPLYGFSRSGGGVLNVTAPDAVCRSVSGIQDTGSGTMSCTKDPFSFALPDPLEGLTAPLMPVTATQAMQFVGTGTAPAIPGHCPGGTPAPNPASPVTCTIPATGGPNSNHKWLLFPGLYPGGIDVGQDRTVYLMPGIYWLGGGGFQAAGGSSVISVESETDLNRAVCTIGATPPCVGGGGVLIYNSFLPGVGAGGAAGPISLGGNGSTLDLQPSAYPFGTTTIDLVIFQDRTVAAPITLNGSNAEAASVRGIMYAPLGDVTVNGSNSTFTMDQVIANTFKINGSGGTVNVLREAGVDAIIADMGLVE